MDTINNSIQFLINNLFKKQDSLECKDNKPIDNTINQTNNDQKDFHLQTNKKPIKRKKDFDESEIGMDKTKETEFKKFKKNPYIRGPYKKTNPEYYYYKIDNKTFKYTKINSSNNYYFYKCSDTSCGASGKLYKELNIFKNEGKHIMYENHSYIISEIFNNKFKLHKLEELNLDNEKKILMFFRTYFKYYNTTSEYAKDEFKKIFPEIDITDNSLQNKINNVYLYSQRKNKQKMYIR